MCLKSVVLLSFSLILSFLSADPEPKVVTGKVSEVTLFRGQAQVVRTLTVEGEKGSLEIVVTQLPEKIVSTSLFAEGSWGVDVRAVRYRTRAVSEESRGDIREIEEGIKELDKKISILKQNKEILSKRLEYLDKLEGFVVPSAQIELSKGILNVAELEKLTIFSFKQRETTLQEMIKLEQEEKNFKEELSFLKRKRKEFSAESSKIVHEALLFLEKKSATPESVRLTYLVNDCSWSPAYNFRADSPNNVVRLEYNAVIYQLSGESWENVKLILSTASPSLSAATPGLAPFQVTLQKNAQRQPNQEWVQTNLKASLQAQKQALDANRSAITQVDNFNTGWAFNNAVLNYQILELTCTPEMLASVQSDFQSTAEGPTFTYPLEASVSLSSRDDQQMVRIMQTDLKTTFYYVATPVLDSFVYREAELTNSSSFDLLNGPASIYLDNRFVGSTEITTVTRGQVFVVGFGAEPQLRTSRELLERKESVQGGNQIFTFHYRLRLENYQSGKVLVRLQDRIPYSTESAILNVLLEPTKVPLSENPLYLRLERPQGILRWEIELAPNTSGEKAYQLEYRYKMEFDRTYLLTNPTGAQAEQMQRDFNEMQMKKSKY